MDHQNECICFVSFASHCLLNFLVATKDTWKQRDNIFKLFYTTTPIPRKLGGCLPYWDKTQIPIM